MDGSYINLFNWRSQWYITTRGSWAEGQINNTDKTWKEIFLVALGIENLEQLNTDSRYNLLDKRYNYVFELCSPYNKVVRYYKEPQGYLLGIFNGEMEYSSDIIDCIFISEKIKKTDCI